MIHLRGIDHRYSLCGDIRDNRTFVGEEAELTDDDELVSCTRCLRAALADVNKRRRDAAFPPVSQSYLRGSGVKVHGYGERRFNSTEELGTIAERAQRRIAVLSRRLRAVLNDRRRELRGPSVRRAKPTGGVR